ncbi:hypothetical protein BTW00_05535 [Psychrobacter sp. C 20.9]|uniref:hypothetical protein n=1 Tax=Psychrobacter sp. C 20.9 TaxID=1926477 RepID=UPI000946F151|nr:hypothetical protein [Psychrobacter sp. C 20.9]OLF36547.1 hypothetical protein BTW00_05535 [Psychrobacter sp. C 20.9]
MKAELELITPTKAASILRNQNENNRNISMAAVNLLAREMKEGRWGLTHQGIAFYDDGTLADGQHRLSAVVASGCSVEFLVTYGTKRESSMFVDTGRARSTGDVVKLSGQADWLTAKMIQMVKLAYGVKRVSASEVILLAEPIKDSLIFTSNLFRSTAKGITLPLRTAVLLAHLCGENKDRLTSFAEMIYSGVVKNDEDTAVVKIRDHLAQGNLRITGNAGQQIDFSKSQTALFKFCRKQPVRVLRELGDLPYPQLDAESVIGANSSNKIW